MPEPLHPDAREPDYPDPGPGPYCCYCQFGSVLGPVVIDLPPGFRNGDPVPADRIYHQTCRDFYPEYLALQGEEA